MNIMTPFELWDELFMLNKEPNIWKGICMEGQEKMF